MFVKKAEVLFKYWSSNRSRTIPRYLRFGPQFMILFKDFSKSLRIIFFEISDCPKRALSLLIAIIIPHLPYRSTPVFLMTLLNTYNHINTILVMLQDYTVGSFYWSLTCLTPSSFIGKISINKLIILAQEFGAINWSRGIIWIWFLFSPTM